MTAPFCEPFDCWVDRELLLSAELNRRCVWCGDLVIPVGLGEDAPKLCTKCILVR